jgi:hypothetical protein
MKHDVLVPMQAISHPLSFLPNQQDRAGIKSNLASGGVLAKDLDFIWMEFEG